MSRKSARPRRRPKTKPLREQDFSDFPESFESPESSNIVRASYDAVTETLKVTFRREARKESEPTNPTYTYHTPIALWVEFYQATSKGKFFAARIRPFFLGRLEDAA